MFTSAWQRSGSSTGTSTGSTALHLFWGSGCRAAKAPRVDCDLVEGMPKSNDEPLLPEDVEREIFEVTARKYPTSAISLILVSQKVRGWYVGSNALLMVCDAHNYESCKDRANPLRSGDHHDSKATPWRRPRFPSPVNILSAYPQTANRVS